MYRRPKFLEILDEVREKMSREADYDVDLFAEMVRNGVGHKQQVKGKIEEVTDVSSLFLEKLSKTED